MDAMEAKAVGAEVRSLARAARQAARRAHAPYSDFPVGVALEDGRGKVFVGANIENASFPLGLCAERVALQSWKQAAGRALRRVVIYTATGEPTTPCGLCREALRAWAPQAQVFLAFRGGISGPWAPESWLPGHGLTPAGRRSR